METAQEEVHQIFQFHRRPSKVVQAKIIHKIATEHRHRHHHNKVTGDHLEVVIVAAPDHMEVVSIKDAKVAEEEEEEVASVAIHVSYFKITIQIQHLLIENTIFAIERHSRQRQLWRR